ncbi:MAG: endonuclease [Candidatus Aenigmatarchaeota archaeon]|nr:MAG: endonuclease [Candidatus Aenigmarchaeota archaeon]
MNVMNVYEILLNHFGHQCWWPVSHKFRPREFEVCAGAILTQNTNWKNVEKALELLYKNGMRTPEKIAVADIKKLEEAVVPSGFYRQKAQRLKNFSMFVMSFGGFAEFAKDVTRQDLLSLSGLGPETADSMLLYALGRRVFVIDAYTKRTFVRLGFRACEGYEEWRRFFEAEVTEDVDLYKEFHALIVELAKNFCRTKPFCRKCPLNKICAKKI